MYYEDKEKTEFDINMKKLQKVVDNIPYESMTYEEFMATRSKPKVSFNKTRKRVFQKEEPSITVSRTLSDNENIPYSYTTDRKTKSSTTNLSGKKFGANPLQSDIDKYYSNIINNPGRIAKKQSIERELQNAEGINIIDRIFNTLEYCFDTAFKGTIFDINFGGGDKIDINEFYNELEKKYSETYVNRIKTLFEKNPELKVILENNQCPINPESKEAALEIYKILLTGKKYVVKGGRLTRKNRSKRNKRTKRGKLNKLTKKSKRTKK